MPDVIAALVQVLKSDSTVASMTVVDSPTPGPPRVWAHEIPDPQRAMMPRASIVVRGGIGPQTIATRSFQQIGDEHVDVLHYAWTMDSARDLYKAVRDCLKQLPPTTAAGTNLKWCNPVSSPIQLREPAVLPTSDELYARGISSPVTPPDRQIEWPLVIATWHVLASEIPVPA